MPQRTYPFLITLGLFGLGLGFIVSSLDPLLYTEKIRLIAPAAFKNSVLSLVTGAALIVALITQPVVGYWSDRSQSHWGPRTPFLTGGVLGLSLALALVGWADRLWLLVLAAMLVSANANIIQSVWQAFIPEYVAKPQRGRATAIKTILEIGGVVLGITVAGAALRQGELWLVPLAGIILFLIVLGFTLYSLPHRQQYSNQNHGSTPSRPQLSFCDIIQNRPFFWWIVNRILFWSAGIILRTFMLNYLNDGLGLSLIDLESINSGWLVGLVAIAIGLILLAGWITDWVGRRPLLIAAGLGGCGGTILLMLAVDLPLLLAGGIFVALSGGIFASASWTLATDLAPSQEQALYLGLANGATVIGSLSGRLGGPLIDGLNYVSQDQQVGYLAAFGLAALFFLLSSLTILLTQK